MDQIPPAADEQDKILTTNADEQSKICDIPSRPHQEAIKFIETNFLEGKCTTLIFVLKAKGNLSLATLITKVNSKKRGISVKITEEGIGKFGNAEYQQVSFIKQEQRGGKKCIIIEANPTNNNAEKPEKNEEAITAWENNKISQENAKFIREQLVRLNAKTNLIENTESQQSTKRKSPNCVFFKEEDPNAMSKADGPSAESKADDPSAESKADDPSAKRTKI